MRQNNFAFRKSQRRHPRGSFVSYCRLLPPRRIAKSFVADHPEVGHTSQYKNTSAFTGTYPVELPTSGVLAPESLPGSRSNVLVHVKRGAFSVT